MSVLKIQVYSPQKRDDAFWQKLYGAVKKELEVLKFDAKLTGVSASSYSKGHRCDYAFIDPTQFLVNSVTIRVMDTKSARSEEAAHCAENAIASVFDDETKNECCATEYITLYPRQPTVPKL